MRPVLVVVAAFTVVTALLAWGRWLAGRHWAAAGHLLLACTGAAAVTAGWPLVSYVAAYEPWQPEQPVAEIFVEQTGSHRYRLVLTRLPAGRMQVFELAGDQWRLDLRALEWSARARTFGLQSRFGIERLASRQDGSEQPTAVHELSAAAGGRPRLAGLGLGDGAPLLRVSDVPGPWQPMTDGARFALRLTEAGAVATEPRNAAAGDSLATR